MQKIEKLVRTRKYICKIAHICRMEKLKKMFEGLNLRHKIPLFNTKIKGKHAIIFHTKTNLTLERPTIKYSIVDQAGLAGPLSIFTHKLTYLFNISKWILLSMLNHHYKYNSLLAKINKIIITIVINITYFKNNFPWRKCKTWLISIIIIMYMDSKASMETFLSLTINK